MRDFNFHATSTTKKNQKNPKITIDDKVTVNYPPAPNASPGTPNNTSSLFPVPEVYNFPYLLRNCNKYFKIVADTKKTDLFLTDALDTDDPDADDYDATDEPIATDNDSVSKDSKNTKIH